MRKFVAALMLAALTISFATAPVLAQDAEPATDGAPAGEESTDAAQEALMALGAKLQALDESADTFKEDAQGAAAACREFLLAHPDHEVAMQVVQAHSRLLESAGHSEEEIAAVVDSFKKQAEGTKLAVVFDLIDLMENLPQDSTLADVYAAMEKLGEKHPNSPIILNQLAMYVGALEIDQAEKTAKVDALLASEGLNEQSRDGLQGWKTRSSRIGTPVSFQFTDLNGAAVDTASWTGKVILVDFWATWCGPCVAEMPRLTELYAEYHPKGLEIVGVSCDNDVEDLKKFVADREVPWTQWPPVEGERWHPEATKWGINGIPTMFLIDKKGVLRSVEARGELEELIPELLAEEM